MFPAARAFFFPSGDLPAAEQIPFENRFFRSLRMTNGTYKTTYDNRMPDVDRMICGMLPHDRPVRLLDVGVSSGVTTLELLDAMERDGIRCETVAADIAVQAYLLRIAGIDLLCDPAGHVIQIATPAFVKARPHDPSGSWKRAALQRAFEFAERQVGGPTGVRRGVPVQLVSPRLLSRTGVRVVEHDLTLHNSDWVRQFDLVRAANVLNYDYFDEQMLGAMLKHLRTYLRPGGLLALIRTHDDTRTNHATVFRLGQNGQFTEAGRIGHGSEIEKLVA